MSNDGRCKNNPVGKDSFFVSFLDFTAIKMTAPVF